MRISDWSSDVCSSDLDVSWRTTKGASVQNPLDQPDASWPQLRGAPCSHSRIPGPGLGLPRSTRKGSAKRSRSEEHTSELQSLMRISYAVFCLKKKNTQNNQQLHLTYTTSNNSNNNNKRKN